MEHYCQESLDNQRTSVPTVTGQSVLAIRYKDGIMMAADTLLCYGKFKKYKGVCRLFSIDQSNTLLGFSGEYSDVQHIRKLLFDLEVKDFVSDTVVAPKTAAEISGYLSRVFYNRRNKFNPLWNEVAVGGFQSNGESYLGYVNYHGTMYSDDYVATGLGAYFAIPLLRSRASPDMPESDARALLLECMTVLFARDCLGYNKIQLATVTKTGVKIDDPIQIHANCEVYSEGPFMQHKRSSFEDLVIRHLDAFTRKIDKTTMCNAW